MTAQEGRELLLKVAADGGGFTTVAGLRARSISLNASTVDITHGESTGQWRELLAGAGVKSASVSGQGIFKDQPSDEATRAAFFAQSAKTWQVILPDFGTLEGPFQITALQFAGTHDGEMTYDLALESAGAISFTGA